MPHFAGDKQFIEAQNDLARLRIGRDMTVAESAAAFSLHGQEAREQHLLDMHHRAPKSMTIREAADHKAHFSAFMRVHERLRRAGK